MSLSFIKSFYLPEIFKTKNGDLSVTVSFEQTVVRGEDNSKEKTDVFIRGENFDEYSRDDVVVGKI